MPHPWVYSATKTPEGKIQFRIEVTDLQTTVGAIEISGIATQVSGAFAPIYRITDIPANAADDPNNPEEAGKYFVNVEADPTPEHAFLPSEDVTVFVRVSKVWVTVLGPGSDDPGAIWGIHRADAHVSSPAGATPVSSMFVGPVGDGETVV